MLTLYFILKILTLKDLLRSELGRVWAQARGLGRRLWPNARALCEAVNTGQLWQRSRAGHSRAYTERSRAEAKPTRGLRPF